jgi:hypothetical protein
MIGFSVSDTRGAANQLLSLADQVSILVGQLLEQVATQLGSHEPVLETAVDIMAMQRATTAIILTQRGAVALRRAAVALMEASQAIDEAR